MRSKFIRRFGTIASASATAASSVVGLFNAKASKVRPLSAQSSIVRHNDGGMKRASLARCDPKCRRACRRGSRRLHEAPQCLCGSRRQHAHSLSRPIDRLLRLPTRRAAVASTMVFRMNVDVGALLGDRGRPSAAVAVGRRKPAQPGTSGHTSPRSTSTTRGLR